MTMGMFVLVALSSLMASSGSQAPPAAYANPCAVCHLRLVWASSSLHHVDEWVTSRHAWYRVGCEHCHGGYATTDAAVAHRGVRNSADPSSAVHRTALPATCGRCHAAEAKAFARGAHRALLLHGNGAAPTSTSCHSSMAANVPSPAVMERECLGCHHHEPQKRAAIARRQLNDLSRIQTALRQELRAVRSRTSQSSPGGAIDLLSAGTRLPCCSSTLQGVPSAE
jgi:hypothetical protein